MIEEEAPKPAEDEYEAEQPKKSRNLKIAAIVVAAIVSGILVWYFVFSNSPPNADFRFEPNDLVLNVSADPTTDPDGNIVSYAWNWGDGTGGADRNAVHTYDAEGDYVVTLTVSDARGAKDIESKSVEIRIRPTADFLARHDRMTVDFDGTRSFSRTGGAIVSWAWDFESDGVVDATTSTATHTYATPGRYRVTLEVADASDRLGNTTRFVSPADTTVDLVADQFFSGGCPYEDYWYLRKDSYGDVILRPNAPCTDFYPWVLFTDKPEQNPSYVYTLYRLDARVRNHLAYNLSEPVVVPVFNRSIAPSPGSYVKLDLRFDYTGQPDYDYWATVPGFELNAGFGDGFGYLVRGNITMDLAMSKRVFDVRANTAAEAAAWWAANTRYGKVSGPIESRVAAWLENLGNTKYDVYNAFEWYYQLDITDLNATVAPDGTTRVQVFWSGWGFDILLARWFYWGNASYQQAVNQPYGAIQPRGWLPMEVCWCEQSRIDGMIRNSLDLNLTAYNGYHFEAWANWGADGIPDPTSTSDDQPAWVFAPALVDYVPRQGSGSPGAQGYPNSELRWYEGLTSVHGAPGSYNYGDPYEYILSPVRWPLRPGSSLTLVMPRTPVPWYDPVRSYYDLNEFIGNYTTFLANMTLRLVQVDGVTQGPGTFYLWDHKAKVFSMAGPFDWGRTDLPLSSSPWIEFGPEATE